MHRGHRKLIETTLIEAKKAGCAASLICFDPDPAEIIFQKRPEHLFSDEERYSIAGSFGIDLIFVIGFDRELMKTEPEEFIHGYLERMNIETLICGQDFSFGKDGKGDPDLLKKTASFKTVIAEEERYEGRKISSTWIKETVKEGNFSLSERLLGFPYYFIFEVKDVSQKGNKWLAECELLDRDCITLKDGMYEGLFTVKNGIFYIERSVMPKKKDIIRVNAS